jgi:serine/threonine protein kinase
VWLGQDLSVLRREVAIKLLPALADQKSVQRFQDEAAALAKLQHPGITVVHDAGSHDGHLFIVMELLQGSDLARVMDHQPDGLPVKKVLDVARQIVDALDAAHSRKVIHRDLKPANLFLLPDDRVKICDFGFAGKSAPGRPSGGNNKGPSDDPIPTYKLISTIGVSGVPSTQSLVLSPDGQTLVG